jgi:hypothetical protein
MPSLPTTVIALSLGFAAYQFFQKKKQRSTGGAKPGKPIPTAEDFLIQDPLSSKITDPIYHDQLINGQLQDGSGHLFGGQLY